LGSDYQTPMLIKIGIMNAKQVPTAPDYGTALPTNARSSRT
jgi:hypothetical protein